jgi:hypothetical protein
MTVRTRGFCASLDNVTAICYSVRMTLSQDLYRIQKELHKHRLSSVAEDMLRVAYEVEEMESEIWRHHRDFGEISRICHEVINKGFFVRDVDKLHAAVVAVGNIVG